MPLHKDLTGTDLHEPKGASTASLGTVYVSDGAGSGVWVKIGSGSIDATSVKNLNKIQLLVRVPDIANPQTVVVPVTQNCTLTNATSCITAAIAGGNAILTLSRAGAATIGTITIDATGSGEGIVDTVTTPTNNTFTAVSYLKIVCDGGPTSGTSDAYVILEFTLT